MTLTQATLFEAIRALIPNIPPSIVPDADLAVYGAQALRRLSEDKPRDVTQQFTSDGSTYYVLSDQLSLWIDGVSSIKEIIVPAPDVTDSDDISILDPDTDYTVYDNGTAQYIRFASAPASGDNVTVRFSTTWAISSIESAITTTLPSRYENAVEHLSAAITCRALASKYAGVTASEVPSDLINYRTKAREYSMLADNWEKQYAIDIGAAGVAGGSTAAAAIGRSAYDRTLSMGYGRMTHPR